MSILREGLLHGVLIAASLSLMTLLTGCSRPLTQVDAASAGASSGEGTAVAGTETVSPGEIRAARQATERGERCREHRGIRAVRSVGCTDEEIGALLGTLPDANRGLDRVVP